MDTIWSKSLTAWPIIQHIECALCRNWSALSCSQALKAHFDGWKRGLVTFRHIASISGAACPALLQNQSMPCLWCSNNNCYETMHCSPMVRHHAFCLINCSRMQNQLLTSVFTRQFIFRPPPYLSSIFFFILFLGTIYLCLGILERATHVPTLNLYPENLTLKIPNTFLIVSLPLYSLRSMLLILFEKCH